MSCGSNRPARYARPRWQSIDLRRWLVHHAGCVYRNCRELARQAAYNTMLGYTKAEQRVRIPRSLRRFSP
jgi:hypothetical protein